MIDRRNRPSTARTRSIFATTAAVATLATLAALATLCWHLYRDGAEAKEKARQIDVFCAKTRNAMLEDRFAFERGDDRERSEARRRFYASEVMYHGSQSVELCLPRLPRTPSECFFVDDWQCLADFAGSIAQSIWETHGRAE